MSKNKELLKKHEKGEISTNQLFKMQDELLVKRALILFAVFFSLALISLAFVLFIWFTS